MSYHLDWCNWATPPHLAIRRGQHVWQIDLIVKWFSIPNGTQGFFVYRLQTPQSLCVLIINHPGTSRLQSTESSTHVLYSNESHTTPKLCVTFLPYCLGVCPGRRGVWTLLHFLNRFLQFCKQAACLNLPVLERTLRDEAVKDFWLFRNPLFSLLSHRSAVY